MMRHRVTPEEHERALAAAARLSDLLARHNIPADMYDLPSGVVVSVFYGLIAHIDDVIWWTIPDPEGTRERPLTTFAHTTEIAAKRLAEHYYELRSVSLPDLLATGQITFIAASLLRPEGGRRAGAPL